MNNMFAQTMVAHDGHESARQAPTQTRDMHDTFGVGTRGEKDTGARMVERSMTVEITNPGMRVQGSPARREEKQRLTARSVDVVARSGNQRPDEVMDSTVDHGFIWGQVGEGDEPTPTAPRPNPWINAGLFAAFAGIMWWMVKSTKKD